MKLRADKFYYPAPDKTIEKVQERMQNYTPTKEFKDFMESDSSDLDKSNYILSIYLKISYDEGFIEGLKETKSENKHSHLDMKIKKRKKNTLSYQLKKNEEKELVSLVKRRLDSKRMRAKIQDIFKEKQMKFEEEIFALTIAINTGYEQGYVNSQSIDNTIKFMLNNDNEKIDMFKDIFQDLLKSNNLK